MADFRVLTLDWDSFSLICSELRRLTDAAAFRPDIIISVPRGGTYVLQYGWPDVRHESVSIIRPHRTSLKTAASYILRYMPLSWRDRLRIWDAKKLVNRSGHMSDAEIILPSLDHSIRRVLLVDDAVDSGATLSTICEEFRRNYPDISFRTAVITVTAANPVFMPDFYLYHNFTLVRMPWSIDAK